MLNVIIMQPQYFHLLDPHTITIPFYSDGKSYSFFSPLFFFCNKLDTCSIFFLLNAFPFP